MRSIHSLLIVLLLALGACASPSPEEGTGTDASAPAASADATSAEATVQDATAPASTSNPSGPERKRMRTGGPLPPERMRGGAGHPVEVDYSCRTDADCAVKNVGNCCGYYPACVNKDSPTDPDGVRAECDEQGRVGVCGFPEIAACTCQRGRCEAEAAKALR